MLPLDFKNRKLFKVTKWSGGSEQDDGKMEVEQVDSLDTADIVASVDRYCGLYHNLMLDIDGPAALVPSSTAGHSHLYIEAAMTWENYAKLLDVLADCGIIERGYADASKARGFTALRLPWVRK